jgi:hypothetical protein
LRAGVAAGFALAAAARPFAAEARAGAAVRAAGLHDTGAHVVIAQQFSVSYASCAGMLS